MQFDWWTFAIQAVNFLALVWLLTRFLYRPVKDVIAKRQVLSEKVFKEAEKNAEAAEAERLKLEQARSDFDGERLALVAQLHKEMQEERQAMLDTARRQAQETVEAAQKSVAEERIETVVAMKKQIVELASDLCTKVLADTGSTAGTLGELQKAGNYFQSLAPADIEILKDDIARANAPVVVVTASALSAAEEAQWNEALVQWFGTDLVTSFVVDTQILGGAELRFPHAVLNFSWAELLRQASDHLLDETDGAGE